MNKSKLLLFSILISLVLAKNSSADIISDVLSGTDNGFGYSGLHHATQCDSMCGANFSSVSLDTSQTSFFHLNELSGDDNFKLYLKLDDFGGSLLTLSGILDFTVPTGDLIGNIDADFSDESIHADTVFKFAQGEVAVGGVNVPSPNSLDGELLSLWGANSSADPLANSIGFDSSTADLGIDLVLRWQDSLQVPEPKLILLFGLGLLALGITRKPRRSLST